MSTHPSLLSSLGACSDAREFCKDHSSLESAWLACERGDWLLWFAARRNVPRTALVLAACECARLALPHTKDPRVLACIETAERWTRGEATLEEVRKARAADADADAYAAPAYAARAAYAAYAAYAATYAATYAAAAAYAAYAAAYAADAAAYAAYAAATSKKTLKQCAEIVRRHFPTLP